MASLKELRNTRLEKLNALRRLGINPYPATSRKDFSLAEISQSFDKFEGKSVTLSGRIMSWREHGNITFGHIQDESGQLQLFISKKDLEETDREKQTIGFGDLKNLDIGDFIQVTGEIIKTTSGEISIKVVSLVLLTKSLRPLPEKWEGLHDPETIFRKRYLDLIINPQRRELFKRKSKFWQANREFLEKQGFIEVETPVLEHFTGGADARPFKTHHNALDEDFYLRISTELYQKRLIGGGLEKVFTLGPNFRNEGIDDEHLQEYYQVEWYWAYADYRNNMDLVKEMFRYIAKKVYGKTNFESHGHKFDLADEWQEIDYTKILKEKFGIDVFSSTDQEILKVVKENGIVLEGAINRNRLIDNLWKLIRKSIAGPAFLINEPKFISPLAKSKIDNPELTERFHVIIAGSELGNGYSELNDPIDQYERFLDQQKARDAGDEESQMMDIDYVEMLEYGMPPVSGYGHSERLFWFFENLPAREATLFPQMKLKIDESVKELYPKFKLINKKQNKIIKDSKGVISKEVKGKFPGISFAYTLITDLEIKKQDTQLEELKKEILHKYKSMSQDEIKEIESIKIYRNMLKETGVDINSRRSSPEALLRRVVHGKGIYTINTAVDAYNLAVLETNIGLGGFDANKIYFPVNLRLSDKGERVLLLGDDELTETTDGEIVYADSEKLLTIDLNYRDNNITKITTDTTAIALYADGGPGIDPQKVIDALDQGAKYIQRFCGGKIGKLILIQ